MQAVILFDEFNLNDYKELSIENFSEVMQGGTFHCSMDYKQVYDLMKQLGFKRLENSNNSFIIEF